jgi:carbon monoxide dehydrogenase subunit G
MEVQIASGAHSAKPVLSPIDAGLTSDEPSPYWEKGGHGVEESEAGGDRSMELGGEERIAAPRDVVWAALNDADILKQCIPGCQSLERKSPTELAATVKLKIGPVSANFSGDVTLTDINPPESYTIHGEGKGGVAGFAKGSAAVTLTEDGDETILRYQTKAQVGGKIAQLGSRLIDSSSHKLASQFFADFNKAVTEKLGND